MNIVKAIEQAGKSVAAVGALGTAAVAGGNFISKVIQQASRTPAQKNFDAFAKNVTTIGNKYVKPAIPVAVAGALGTAYFGDQVVQPIIDQTGIAMSRAQLSKYTPSLEFADKGDIKTYFNVLKTFSPQAAKNPVVAGAIVNKMIDFGGVDHKLIQDLLSLEKGTMDIASARSPKPLGIMGLNSIGSMIPGMDSLQLLDMKKLTSLGSV